LSYLRLPRKYRDLKNFVIKIVMCLSLDFNQLMRCFHLWTLVRESSKIGKKEKFMSKLTKRNEWNIILTMDYKWIRFTEKMI
jgi:hypothetical protein